MMKVLEHLGSLLASFDNHIVVFPHHGFAWVRKMDVGAIRACFFGRDGMVKLEVCEEAHLYQSLVIENVRNF